MSQRHNKYLYYEKKYATIGQNHNANFLLFKVFPTLAQDVNTLSVPEKKAGWKLLFDNNLLIPASRLSNHIFNVDVTLINQRNFYIDPKEERFRITKITDTRLVVLNELGGEQEYRKK